MKTVFVLLIVLLLATNGAWAWNSLNAWSLADDLTSDVKRQQMIQRVLTRLVVEAPRTVPPEGSFAVLRNEFSGEIVKLNPEGNVEVGGVTLVYKDDRLTEAVAW